MRSTRTRFKYLLKFELFQPHPLLGVCEGGRQGRKELVFSLQPHHILFARCKGMLYPEKKAYVIENCWDFSEPEERKPWKPCKWEGLPLSSQLTWNHYSPGHFESSIRKNRLLKRHSHQNTQHFQPLSTPPEDQDTRSFGCTASKPVSFSDKLLHGYISFWAETSTDLKYQTQGTECLLEGTQLKHNTMKLPSPPDFSIIEMQHRALQILFRSSYQLMVEATNWP